MPELSKQVTQAVGRRIAVEGTEFTEALVKGVPIFVDGLGASKLRPSDLIDISASLIPADELDETRALQPA